MILKRNSKFKGALSSFAWLLYGVLTLLALLWLSWLLLVRVNFIYPVWYEVLSIDDHIKRYGPQNNNRQHFDITTKKEHQRLFAGIVKAIHQQGEGLAQLRYHNTMGRPIATLLTPAEIIHLRDVARLVELFKTIGWGTVVLTLLATIVLLWQRYKLPTLKHCLLGLIGTMLLIGLLVVLIGPVKVFYQLHIWLFPADHQWFFYYQDSLLTTLLKAPAIFGPIVLLWLSLAMLLVVVWWWLLRQLQMANKTR